MENRNDQLVLVLSCVVSILSAYAAILGFINKTLYSSVMATGVFKNTFIAGTISQDMLTIGASIVMIVLILRYAKLKEVRFFIGILGLLGYFFYGYATYVISALYTSIYLVYMMIFTLSLFGLIFGLCGFKKEEVEYLELPKPLIVSSSLFLIFIVLIFTIKWTVSIIPFTQSHTVPDFYAIFILDLCIVMPFFVIVVYMLLRKMKYSYILLGIALIKTSTLILAVSIGSFIAPLYGNTDEIEMIVVYCCITVISFVLMFFYFAKVFVKLK